LKLPLAIVTLIMNVPPIITLPFVNVLKIYLLKYHDNGNPTLHMWQLTKVCVTNGKDTNCHKLQYFPNSRRGKVANLFGRYEIAHPTMTWAKAQRAFITRFNEIRNEGQATIASWHAKQKKHESIEDYYDQFLQLCSNSSTTKWYLLERSF
jgi:hypothetical protein